MPDYSDFGTHMGGSEMSSGTWDGCNGLRLAIVGCKRWSFHTEIVSKL